MRATGNPPTPTQITADIWAALVTDHVAVSGSFGEDFQDIFGLLGTVHANYARRTPYTYGPTSLVAGATYIPAAGTVVTIAALDGVADDDFRIMHGTIVVMQINQGDIFETGFIGALYCDGTDVGIKNNDAGDHDLVIEGFTI